MKPALCQYDIKWEDKEANKAKIERLLGNCPRHGEIDWLIFPEMTLSGFTMNTAISELNDADRNFFRDLAQKRNINISYGGVEGGFNKLITVNRHGDRINAYSKIHLYAFGGEDKYYKAGSKQEFFELEGFKVTPVVCFDLRFPYLFWNQAEKTDIYLVIAVWPMRRAEHWMTLLRARAVENQAYCVGVNRLGFEGKVEYSGNSMCFDPLGKPVLDAGAAEGVFLSETGVDKDLVARTRARFPFLKERRKMDWM
ncbi:MAG: carbon-nitrogen family hydrolase [Elusimicrobia bacterium]|nr:carbon-nitrogen family hydrolase [Elusimicrobiota bacterium]